MFQHSERFQATLFFRASASCSKLLNDKKIHIQCSENFRANSVFQSKRKLLKNPSMIKYIAIQWKIPGQLCFPGQAQVAQKSWIIKYIYSVLWIQGTLCFYRASASCSKLLNCKKYIQYRETFQGKLCFQVKHKFIKILNIKRTFTTVKIFRATLFFSGQAQVAQKS